MINLMHSRNTSLRNTLVAAALSVKGSCERCCVRAIGWLLILFAAWWFSPASFAATGTCGPATGQGTNGPADYSTYCWIDFTNYSNAQATSAGGEPFTISLPGGGILSFTLNVSGGALAGVATPTWSGAAMGHSAFLGIPGNPALYQTTQGTTTNVSMSNISLTVGTTEIAYAIVAADAESTNQGESLSFTTNGSPWTILAAMQNGASPLFPTLSGCSGTSPGSSCGATVTETGVAGSVGAYAYATNTSPTTISSVLVGSGLQGIAFAVKFYAVDLAITSSHTGNFNLGSSGSYALTVTNNGPNTYPTPNTITVTDTLPSGLTYASASGSGWSCSASGQVVTCTTSASLAAGASLPPITLNVNVGYTTAATVTNTATVSSNPNYDYNLSNNTSNDVTTLVDPNLSTSTKSVVNTSGGDALVGSTLQYTITLQESAGVTAINASVTDDVPANLSNFTVVSFPGGATNSSTATGGANNDGYLNITGITVPANGSVTVVFTAQVAGGTANCTQINNSATINNPYGTGATPAAPTVTVAQSACASSGNKVLYLYDNTGPTYTSLLNRVPQTVNSSSPQTITGGGGYTWTMSPGVATGKTLVLTAGTVVVTLVETATGNRAGSARPTTVTLLNNGAAIATSGTVNVAGGVAAYTYTITVPVTTVVAGNALGISVTNSGGNNRNLTVSQMTAGLGRSTVTFATSTVIKVNSVTAYNAAYPSTTTVPVFVPGNTVYICAVISDPFGSYDIDPTTGGTAPKITLTDPNGTLQVNAAAMSKEGATDCSGTANAADEAFEYTYAVPTTAKTGYWTAAVTGYEGTEGTINNTANGSFDLDVPSLLVMKTVLITSDPVEGTTRPKALPGATAQYTILVQNNGRGPVDNGTMVISDPVPAHTVLSLPSTPPFAFTNGSTPSGLSITAGSDANIVYSNNGGSSYSYVPSCTRPCTDSTITNFKITLNGSMNGETGASAPSFTITFNVIIQ